MKNIFLMFFLFVFSTTLWANAGVFRGRGQTPQLENTNDIQMVEEEVSMFPMRGNYPIDMSVRNQDQMKYHCTFKLRNLSDKIVTIPVGFPLSTETVWFHDPSMINQTEVIGRFGFVAGTKDYIFPVRYVPYDKNKKFSSIFLWDMTFQPKQEITLFVQYTMGGYYGLMSTRKQNLPRETDYKHSYLAELEMGIGHGHMYVTATGGCWAGKIEKAVFKLYPYMFEEYLEKRGAWEESPEDEQKRIQRSKKEQTLVDLLTPKSPMVRSWNPEREQWKVVLDQPKNKSQHLELVYTPFEPKDKDSINISYVFAGIPTTIEQFDLLLDCMKSSLNQGYAQKDRIKANVEKMKKENLTQYEELKQYLEGLVPYTPAVKKNLTDVVLEFYGIGINNPEIQDFLEAQCWYPVKEPPYLSPELKAYLEASSSEINTN